MKPKLFFCKHHDCKDCTETVKNGFKYRETKAGDKLAFDAVDLYTIIFLLKGEVMITCNEFVNVPFYAGEIVLCPVNSKCVWETQRDTNEIILTGNNELSVCDRKVITNHTDEWLEVVSDFYKLPIKSRLLDFLHSVKNYLEDGITCPHIYKTKLDEISTLFRAYYSPEEIRSFFFPVVSHTDIFEKFIMDNYLKMKGVKEFVDLSGMNLSTFNRKFKAHFKETPYQWIIKQRAKHIFREISSTDKSFVSIAKQFHFSDASHFNRYCKTMFGASPSQIRKKPVAMNQGHSNFILK